MLTLKKISNEDELKICHSIRREVFVVDQKISEKEEFDNSDEGCLHFLLYKDEVPVGTVRVRPKEEITKIERVAVLKEYSGQGFGKEMMVQLLEMLKEADDIKPVFKLSAQTRAIGFYEKLGFKVVGEEYPDAGIPHKDMSLDLTPMPSLMRSIG